MPRWLQVILHALLAAANFLMLGSGSIGPKFSLVIGAAQAFLGCIAQQYNTDGTPQSAAFQKNEWRVRR